MAERRSFHIIILILAAVAAVWVLAACGLGILLPFLLGYLTARLAEPLVRYMAVGSSLPRWACSGICVSIILLLLAMAVFFLGRILISEAAVFIRQVPQMLTSLSEPLQQLQTWLEKLARRAPDGLGTALQAWVERLFTSGSVVVEKGSELLLSAASNVIVALPDILLFAVTTVLASFMISSRLPSLRQTAGRYLPAKWKGSLTDCVMRLKNALGGWIKAQLKLMGITFLILTAGLRLLGVEFSILFAGLISLIDALPVFGVGTVLIPWAVISFLRQDTYRAVGLLILYGTAALTRTSLEPRLIGKQIGLNPLITLLAMYAGYRLCGIVGMILFPVSAILLQQFLELLDKSKKEQPERGL